MGPRCYCEARPKSRVIPVDDSEYSPNDRSHHANTDDHIVIPRHERQQPANDGTLN